jgi:REP element-mobilizing transposase RayT
MPEKLQFDPIYHIYNRGNNRENLFRSRENYLYFLKLFSEHVAPVVVVFAYCLLPNHFHFLLRLKSREEILGNPDLTGFWKPVRSNRPHQPFSNCFNAYTKAFNNRYQRTGALFERPFGRKLVDSPRYFNNLVVYIHRNPQKHGLVDDFRDWPYSSYEAVLSEKPTQIARAAVLDWFGTRADFCHSHQQEADEAAIAHLLD